MSQAVAIRDMLNVNSSALPAISNALQREVYAPSLDRQLDIEMFTSNYRTHESMVRQNASVPETVQPIRYVRFQHPLGTTANSSFNVSATVRDYYDKIERQLLELSKAKDDVHSVEEGAVQSALSVIDQLKKYQLAPPELSWHGGDAVVMLWSLSDTTYAITVTDGELGYVVRRNRKAIKIADSISLNAFRLRDMS